MQSLSSFLCRGTIHRALLSLNRLVVGHFKGLADETGLPYQKLIDLYLLDYAKKRKKLTTNWVA